MRSLQVNTFPTLIDPGFALELWQMSRDEFADAQPTALLTFGYESQSCMSVELAQQGVDGGAIFQWDIVDGGFRRQFNDFADWLLFHAAALDQGNFDVIESTGGSPPQRMLSIPGERGYAEFTQAVAPAHPLYGDQTTIGRDIMEWPDHWRRLAGITDETVALRGATHSIEELLESSPDTSISATLVGTVVGLHGIGSDAFALVDDGTGMLMVRCPASASALGPVIRETFEFDVEVPMGERVAVADPDVFADGSEEQFIARHNQSVGAVAMAIRRV